MRIAILLLAAITLHAEVVRTPVPNGGELVTVFETNGLAKVPIIAYLKDTMGDRDPANDKLRQVWILAHKRQSLPRHLLAAIPFLYTRLPSSPPPPGRVPPVILDLSKPYHGTMNGLFQQLVQVTALDPLGMPYRAATRSYRLNRGQQRDLRVAEAVSALSGLTSGAEVRAIRSRLILSSRLLGGLVSDENLELVNEKETIRAEEMRGRNWELLRQQAERNHLKFEPLRLAGGPPSHALISISQNDLATMPRDTPFHGRFLSISNPWTDNSLRKLENTGGDIHLALYSLEHPKVPFLLADMRDTLKPRRREMIRRAAQDATVGVFGVSRFASLHYFAASWAWDFISNRRGAANNRAWRVRSYAELRQKLNADTTLDGDLRNELKERTKVLSINPLEDRLAIDGEIARVQYASLQTFAANPKGMALMLERGRQDEASLYLRGPRRRAALEFLRWATLGLYHRRVPTGAVMLAEVDRRRKIQTHTRYLEQALRDSPMFELAGDAGAVRHAIRELTRLDRKDAAIADLLARAARQAGDSQSADGGGGVFPEDDEE